LVTPLAVYQVEFASQMVGPSMDAAAASREPDGTITRTGAMSFAPFVPSAAGAVTEPPSGGRISALAGMTAPASTMVAANAAVARSLILLQSSRYL
jgi:hypothetical protein